MDIKRILESNLVVIPQLEEIAKILNESASLGDDRTARMLLSMVLCYPLGLLTSYFPSSSLRHLWSLLVGVVLVQFVFGVGWVHLLIPSAGVYAILALCRATGLAKQYRHWIASLFSFSYLVHRHLSRTSVKSNNIDESTLVMVLIIKLYTLCFNLYDAETYPSERAALDGKIKREEDPQKRSKLTRELDALEKKKDRSVKDLPNPLEFLAYVFNFPTVFCGPAFEFGEYKAAQDQISDEGNYLPTRFIPGLWKLLQGIVWFALTAVLQAYYPTTEIYPLSRPDSGASRLDLFRYIFLAIWFSRFKYYAVWKLSDGAAVLAGFGRRKSTHFSKKPNPAYTDLKIFTGSEAQTPTSGSATMDTLGLGIKGSSDWEGASNCNALAVETRNSIAEQIENWNIHTQSWLKYYVFFRLPQGYNRAITFLASAFWHGCVFCTWTPEVWFLNMPFFRDSTQKRTQRKLLPALPPPRLSHPTP